MKKIFLLALISAFALTTRAQESAVGLEVGFAQTDFRLNSWFPSDDGTTLNLTTLNGFKLGFLWDVTYIKGFGSTLGLRYTYGTTLTGWTKVNDEQIGEYPRYKERLNYNQLELYVDWQYKFEIAADTYIMLTSGPAIQCGLAMSGTTYYQSTTSEWEEPTIQRFDYNGENFYNAYHRVNVTWGIGAGFQYDRFFIRGGYDFGLMNPYKIKDFTEIPELKDAYGGDSRYTRGRLDQWHIRIGFYFAQFDK